ncbi:hypothetical protein BV898_12102 [Hypsibius exemplaris]|uniref:Uncharacterized protein n=1 Tax=Hypsibius exemplaris TaxID=2072580 RepID=A0A1W0WEU7_HYPEX|nr:hypothetical protein BV898_12102 [Hypsibius exemplaris]
MFIDSHPVVSLTVALCLLFLTVGHIRYSIPFSALNSTSCIAHRQFCGPSNVSPAWIYKMHPWTNKKGKYSQGSQDLYLHRIFAVIGSTNRYFVEFGFNEPSYTSGGSGANTRNLYQKGWRGLLLDGDRENAEINLQKHFLFANNIAQIFAQYNVPKELDYLSVDMDSHDLWVFRAILEAGYRPRVITTEYNANYPLTHALTLIDPTLIGNGSVPSDFSFEFTHCAWGASAKALFLVATTYGYKMVGRIDGLDLVWLRADLISDCFLVPEFEWFFRDIKLGSRVHNRQKDDRALRMIVDYETFVKTRNLTASNAVARDVLRRSKLDCFYTIRKII